jgi:hypothetical protein
MAHEASTEQTLGRESPAPAASAFRSPNESRAAFGGSLKSRRGDRARRGRRWKSTERGSQW